jgi:putative ABC transport system permease protein
VEDNTQMLRDLVQDLHYACRTAVKTPGFVATAIATLAVGIGATVGIFSVVNAVLLRPLPIPAPAELVVVNAQNVQTHATVSASWTKYQLVRDQNQVFSGVGAWIGRELAFSDGTTPEQVNGARVTWNFFNVLGVVPAAGRTFRPDDDIDDLENAAPVAVVTDGFVQRRLGGNAAAAVGRRVTIEGRATTIVGSLPPGFRYEFTDREPQIYLTAVFTPGVMTVAQIRHGAGFLGYIGRLRPGVAIEDAVRDLASLDARYRKQFGSYVDASRFALHAVPLTQNVVGDVRPGLLVLMGAVALVLLIACANVAHLLLARAAARQHEIAVRLAIGASRGRVIRQLLTESVLLSLAGCAVGWWAVSLVIDVLVAHAPANIPRLRDTQSDLTVLAFATAISLATGVLFGITPALRATRLRASDVLKDTRSDGRSSGMTRRLHHLLAVSETAVTVALLIAAGLLFQSFMRMQHVDVGFQPANVYAAHVSLPRAKYAEPPQRERFFTQLLDRLRQQPGLANTGAISYLPMSGSNYGFIFYREESPDRENVISVHHVGGAYFRTMQIPLRRGRVFTDRDDARSTPVAIINESTARHFFADADPLGRRLASTSDRILREIVGVVADVRFDGPARSGQDELYVPYQQIPWPSMTIVVRSPLAPDEVVAALRREVALLDPEQAVADIRPLTAIVDASMSQQEFTSGLFGVFAVLATTLAVVGLYGVMTLFVGERRREFGIRMALGARPADLVQLVMTEAVWMVGIGAAAGILGALALRRAVSNLLFGITASDVTTYAVSTAIVCAVGVIACYVPVRRAAALDPVHALRN